MVRSAGSIVDKQQRKAVASVEDYTKGIAEPERNPIEAALKANKKRVNKLLESIKNKSWENRMSKLSIEDWQKPTQELGPDRYEKGVRAHRDKIEKFWDKFQPALQKHQDAIRAMPDETPEDREKRLLENLRGMRALKGKGA